MKTLEINTPKGPVTLSYSEVDKHWSFFNGSQEAMNYLDNQATEMGWVYDRKKKNFQADFIAENAEIFNGKEKDQTPEQLWADQPEDWKEENLVNRNSIKTREFLDGISNLQILLNKNYRKVVHVNGNTAALFFFGQFSDKSWYPMTGSDYYSINNLPKFIKRHIDMDIIQKYLIDKSQYPHGIMFENKKIVDL